MKETWQQIVAMVTTQFAIFCVFVKGTVLVPNFSYITPLFPVSYSRFWVIEGVYYLQQHLVKMQ